MNIITIDTSTDWCGVSYFYKSKCKAIKENLVPRKHSELLPGYIRDIFNEQNIRIVRPGYGAPPHLYHQLLGRTATRDYKSGTPLSLDNLL